MARLILWPGLAADERMYQRLEGGGWQLETPCFPAPTPGESLAGFAARCSAESGSPKTM